MEHFQRQDRLGDETVGDMLAAVGDLLLRCDGGDGEGLAEQGVNVQLRQLLHLDEAARLENLVEMIGQLVVDGLDKLEEVGDLLHAKFGLLSRGLDPHAFCVTSDIAILRNLDPDYDKISTNSFINSRLNFFGEFS